MTKIAAYLVAFFAFAVSSPANALNATTEDPLRMFAGCLGRYAATLEHQWMSTIEDRQTLATGYMYNRNMMEEMVTAIMPDDQGPAVLEWRINAKIAQARLLNRATFNADRTDASWATTEAVRQLDLCGSLILTN